MQHFLSMCVNQHWRSHFAGREPDMQTDLRGAASQLQSQDHKPDFVFPQGWFYSQSTLSVLGYFT